MGIIVTKFNLFDVLEKNIKFVGVTLLITAIFLYIIKDFKGIKEDKDITLKDALIIGFFQVIALLPGISRSGATIVGGMTRKLKRDTAFKYSFMLYIPMSLAAMALEITKINLDKSLILHYALAVLVAAIVTFLVTKWFRKIVNEGKLIFFSVYCFIVGLLVVIFL